MRSKIVAAFALVGFALAACEQLIGLDQFQKCDTCTGDASVDTGTFDASDAAPNDAFVLPDGLSEASSWPIWRMPNVPVEIQTGASDASLASFTFTGNGFVHDDLTNLTWNVQLGAAGTIDEAAAHCALLGARLPTRIEAATLLDSTRTGSPFTHVQLDPIFSPDGGEPAPVGLWTSSYSRPITSPLHFWFAWFVTGDMIATLPVQGLGVLCLK